MLINAELKSRVETFNYWWETFLNHEIPRIMLAYGQSANKLDYSGVYESSITKIMILFLEGMSEIYWISDSPRGKAFWLKCNNSNGIGRGTTVASWQWFACFEDKAGESLVGVVKWVKVSIGNNSISLKGIFFRSLSLNFLSVLCQLSLAA